MKASGKKEYKMIETGQKKKKSWGKRNLGNFININIDHEPELSDIARKIEQFQLKQKWQEFLFIAIYIEHILLGTLKTVHI